VVGAGQTRNIVATFNPVEIGERLAMLTIRDDDGLSPTPARTFNLTGTATDDDILLSPPRAQRRPRAPGHELDLPR